MVREQFLKIITSVAPGPSPILDAPPHSFLFGCSVSSAVRFTCVPAGVPIGVPVGVPTQPCLYLLNCAMVSLGEGPRESVTQLRGEGDTKDRAQNRDTIPLNCTSWDQ